MTPAVAKRFRLLASAVSVLVVLAALAGGWFYVKLRASLPQLDGGAVLAGLSREVTVQRDALGVPTIRGANRVDVARALGYLHAQDRFFQMDTLRRRAAGELSELFGAATVPVDRAARLHGFRRLAQTVLVRLPATERALLEAYAAGANSGLAALRAKPFEYFVLRVTPQPWRAEDSILVSYAMTLDLQESTGNYERSLMVLRDQFGMNGLAFFAPLLTPNARRDRRHDRAAAADSRAGHDPARLIGSGVESKRGARSRFYSGLQQLRPRRDPNRQWRGPARERHASHLAGPQHVVSRLAGVE